MNFWEVLKEVSTNSIRAEAGRLFVLSLAGDPQVVAAAHEAVLGPRISAKDAEAATPFVFPASPPYSPEAESRLRYSDLLVSLPGGPGVTDFRPADTIQVDRPEDVVAAVLARRPDLLVTLGRRLPGFRSQAAERVIRDVSRANAEFAALSTVSQAIPIVAPLFPVITGADILLLTKNQVLMIFRLAAIYGEELTPWSRVKEVAPVIGGAFGWRTLARELAGALPGALGLPLRAGIAFSGTYAVGRAAQMVFDEGRRPTRKEMARIYEEGTFLAKGVVTALKDRLLRKKDPEPQRPPAALPEPRAALPPPVTHEASPALRGDETEPGEHAGASERTPGASDAL